jgi:hypothetical protein
MTPRNAGKPGEWNHSRAVEYLLKEGLGLLWEQPSYARMKSLLHQWCAWATESGVR